MRKRPTLPPAEEPKPCHLGIVFALGIESGCFEDLLGGVVTIRGNGFVAREGGLHGRRVVIILSGPGRQHAARATEVLIDGHRPGRVISAGFAGGLSPELKRNDILIADRLLLAPDTKPRPVVAPLARPPVAALCRTVTAASCRSSCRPDCCRPCGGRAYIAGRC